jgi:hypothetical protein
MNRCVIHIGMHKTGSTSIQYSLAKFHDDRFLYAQLGKDPNHSLAVYSLFATNPGKHRMHLARSAAAVDDYLLKMRKDLDRAISAARGRTLLISGEGIVGLKPNEVANMAAFFRSRFDAVTVVGYVRPPASFMSSAFQQRVIGGALSNFDLKRIYRNYQGNFEKFDAAFGRENVRLWKFEPAQFADANVVKDFCARLQINLSPRRVVYMNESISRQVVGLLYTYHKYCTIFGATKMNAKSTERLAMLLRHAGADKFRLSPNILRPILQDNKADVEWMEERLGDSLQEQLGNHQPGDVRDEKDLLRPDPVVGAKLLAILGNAAPKNVKGHTPREIATLIHALRSRPKLGRFMRWFNRNDPDAGAAE